PGSNLAIPLSTLNCDPVATDSTTQLALTLDRKSRLLNATLAPAQKIDQHKLRKIVWIGKVSLAVGHRGHLLYEFDEIIITGQHEGVDHDAGFATGLHFAKCCFHYEWIAAHRVFVQSSVRTARGASAGRMPATR